MCDNGRLRLVDKLASGDPWKLCPAVISTAFSPMLHCAEALSKPDMVAANDKGGDAKELEGFGLNMKQGHLGNK